MVFKTSMKELNSYLTVVWLPLLVFTLGRAGVRGRTGKGPSTASKSLVSWEALSGGCRDLPSCRAWGGAGFSVPAGIPAMGYEHSWASIHVASGCCSP